MYDSYFERFAGLKNYFAFVFKKASFKHYIQFNNITKRKYFIPFNSPFIEYATADPQTREGFEYRKAAAEIQRFSQNYPIQGSAADCTKLAAIYIYNEIVKNNWFDIVKIINIVHDEIEVECPEHMKDTIAKLVKNSMEKAGDIFCKIVKLTASIDIGDHWIH